MKIYRNRKEAKDFLELMMTGRSSKEKDVISAVENIIKDVKEKGDEAVRKYTLKFDGVYPEKIMWDRDDMEDAYKKAPEDMKTALEKAKSNIWEYHIKQKPEGYEIKKESGAILGQTVRGLSRVAIYVPGGRAAYPSTVLMNTVPAKIAEVEEIIMLTPATGEGLPNPDILTAAYIAGVDKIYLIGGAQGVAATAFGTETVPKADKIVGPGNAYVAEAKRSLFGIIDIDMIAGPSEILVLTDETGNPEFIAADMLSQAEHDPRAASLMLTTDENMAEKVLKEIELQVARSLRKEVIEESLESYGGIIVCDSIEEMIETADDIAPEHLELMIKDPMKYLNKIKNAGAIFLGEYSPEPLGDYFSGTNHVLPTGGTARFASPLGVEDFVKRTEYTYYTKEQLEKDSEFIETIATVEGLYAHRASISIRKKGKQDEKNQ